MKSIANVLLVFLSCVSVGVAQVPDDFSRLVCGGEIPSDFTSGFNEKFKSDFNEQLKNSELKKKDAREFAVLTNYYNHNLLQSGSVLFGDPISNYAEQILDRLLRDNQELRSEVRVYTIKSNHVNAYSTNQGIIFVTLGLMAKVQNEAQLAFVLAHELGHYKERHVFESFADHKLIWSNSGSYRNMKWEDKTLTSFKHSRNAEFEADEKGLELYLNAGYDKEDIDNGFDVLLLGYLPIEQRVYDFSVIEDDSFKIPGRFFIDSVDAIIPKDDVDDTEHTHPNVKKRKEAVAELLAKAGLDEMLRKTYWVKSEQGFDSIRDLSRFEMINTFLRNTNYMSALYHIQVMQQKYPTHPFLKRAELMCWSGMQMFANNRQKRVYSPGYRKLEGEEQAMYYFASKMSKKGVNVIATRFIWTQTEDMEKDEFVTALREQCVRELPKGGYTRKHFLKDYPEPIPPGQKKKRVRKYDFVKTGFVELFKDSAFSAQYTAAYDAYTEEDEFYNYDEFDSDEEEDVIADENVAGVFSYYGLSGVNKLLYFTPKFFRIDLRKNQDEMFLTSDMQQRDLEARSERLSKLAGVDLISINDQKSHNYTTEAFNDYTLLGDWLREESQYNGRMFYSFTTPNLKVIREKYGTDYLGVNYIWHFTDTKEFSPLTALVSAVYVIPFPFYLYWQFKPDHQLDYLFAVFDLKGGDMEFVDSKSFSAKYRKDIINAHLFNSFNQLSR